MGLAAHDAARYTAAPEAVQLTATAAERVEGPLSPCLADYAQARLSDDPDALSAVSVRFETIGALLYAAEAAYAAARAHRGAGNGRAAAQASVRAAGLHAQCENAAIAWATGFQSGELLTRREEQVALLAAAGHPDAAIATELKISIRTVQNHLARAYRKLAITSRNELANALPTTS
jgi:DNA-binding CsgD family transcriptional regulator